MIACPTCSHEIAQGAPSCAHCGSPSPEWQAAAAPAEPDALAERLQLGLGEEYAVEHQIGEGGFAVVYAVTDHSLSRRIAVKVLRPELTVSKGAKQRFIREAESAARLNHPHILPIFFVGEGQGLVWFGMPLVDGDTLDALLRRAGSLPEADAARIGAEIADALAEAHAQGLVHRDIKPQNVMLQGPRRRVVVADFGIAKAAAGTSAETERLTHTGAVVGSPHYMSPEQASGSETIDHRSDIYSLGIVLWQALAGVVPFAAGGSQAVLMQQATQPVPPIRTRRAGISSELAAVIDRCTAKHPEDRFETADHLAAALRAVAARPLTTRRDPRRAVVAALALVALGAFGAASLLRRPDPAGAGGTAASAGAPLAAPSIAVLPFSVVTSQDTAQFARAMAGVFTEALAQRNGVETVDANTLLGLWDADVRRGTASLDSLARFAYGLGANQMILGAYVESGRQFRLTVNMYDTHDLSRVWRDEATGSADSLFALVDRLAARAATALCGQPEYNPANLCFDTAARPSGRLEVTIDERPPDGVDAVGFYARVAPDGQLTDVRLRTDEGSGEIASRALTVLRNARFEPARKGGQAVESWTAVMVPVRVRAGADFAAAIDPRCDEEEFGTRNADRLCWEARPVPTSNLPVVSTPVTCSASPTPATVLVRVGADGAVAAPPRLTSASTCRAFNDAALRAAAQIVFAPAQKDGRAVPAWTQVLVRPAEPGADTGPGRRVS